MELAEIGVGRDGGASGGGDTLQGMRELLLWFTFFVTVILIAMGVAIALFSRQLSRQNQVDPDVASPAPLLWLWSPAQPARLHRRLRTAARAVYQPPPPKPSRLHRDRSTPPPEAPTAELARDLRRQATTLDGHLVQASRLPKPARKQHLRLLSPQVTEVERLASRLVQHERRVTVAAQVPGPVPFDPTPPEALASIAGQLDVLEQAHDELAAIERANGLLDPDELMRRAVAPAPQPVQPVQRVAAGGPRSTRPPVGPRLAGPTPPPASPPPPQPQPPHPA